jgi:peptide chain release factor 3
MVKHVPSGKSIRLANSTLLMGKDRTEMAEAFPGDVIGLFDPGLFRIGDTLCSAGSFHYPGIPSFPPEHFVRVEVAGAPKRKALAKGIDQLVQEGAVQLFHEQGSGSAAMILGAMGPLQFEVMSHRLEREYKVDLRLVQLPFTAARWVGGGLDPDAFRYSETAKLVYDRDDRPVLLFANAWGIESIGRLHPNLELLSVTTE